MSAKGCYSRYHFYR